MRISVLTIGAIASIITTAAFADTTVTSKTYVDTTRQATIPTAGTNSSTPGSTVVTYTSTAGTIGERGICNDPDDDDCGSSDLTTVGFLQDNLPAGATCYERSNSGECILVYMPSQCTSRGDCNCYENGHFAGQRSCENGVCTGECEVM